MIIEFGMIKSTFVPIFTKIRRGTDFLAQLYHVVCLVCMYRILILNRLCIVYRILALEIAIKSQLKGRSCPFEFIVALSSIILYFGPKLGRDFKIYILSDDPVTGILRADL